ncbi:ABC transporter substrate-binding protein [Allonocardiopsis opalescens]|uniref:Peptide/nickel transport system substrate-binding protein n=1 Tax=Allonocardiopsis opalescens TaxID=1144618 RepID=A0A2T0Q9L2_9ACTN|nr:ABC transporter substrate-binding protein [Allonocardiopsis opalescens]PRY00533.1 peptide/nickel transport system substrate-binding protein [Allonocardiopsis opalescens]
MVAHRTTPASRARRYAALLGALAVLLLVTPLTAGGASAEEDAPTTMTVAVAQTPDSLSPFLGQRLITTNIYRLIYEHLTAYDQATNEPIGAIAESWEFSDDGLTWTYHLREDLTWSDDQPLTADDVVWTFTTMMEDEGAATANGNFVENFESVTAPDEHTVVIELSQPQATMLALDVPILPRHIWENVEDYGAFHNDTEFPIVGSGPFILTEYEPEQFIRLEANPDYWRERETEGFDEIVFRFYTEQDAMVEALRTGEVSLLTLPLTPAQAASLEGEPNIAINNATGKRFFGFTINPGAQTVDGEEFGDGHPALRDQEVRTAIMHAIDRDALVERVEGGFAEAAHGYIPSRYDDYHWEPTDEQRIDYDPELANQILDEAGYETGDDGVRVSPDGDRMALRIHVHADRPNYVQTADFLAQWLGEIGIEAEVLPVAEVGDALTAGEYDLIFTGWNVNPDPDYVLAIHRCDALPREEGGSMQSDAYFCDEEYDELYERQAAETDPAARAETVRQMQEILYESAVVNVLSYPNAVEAYRSDQIASIQVQPDPGGNIWGQDGHWSFWSAQPAAPRPEGAGNSPLLWIGVGAAVVVAAGLGVLLWRRRSSATADDRE